jgi:hypothetical protein
MEIGVVVVVRVPGAVVHRLALGKLHVRLNGSKRVLELGIANRGNVTEPVGPERLRVQILRAGRIVGRGRPSRREFLPRSRGIEEIAYRGRVSGPVTVVVGLSRGSRTLRRVFHLRL